jgi:hypothetical protein
LDNLDELGLERQKESLEKLDEFLQKNPDCNLQMVVCCRLNEYLPEEIFLQNLQWAICFNLFAISKLKII